MELLIVIICVPIIWIFASKLFGYKNSSLFDNTDEKRIDEKANVAKYPVRNYEIDRIFNTKTSSYTNGHRSRKCLLAIDCVEAGTFFSMDTLMKYHNPSCDSGWTVAHEMAKQKYEFSVEELEKLGNPCDIRNLSISDIMILNGHTFTESEKSRLGITDQNLGYTACATYEEDSNAVTFGLDLINICPKCGCEFCFTDLPALFTSGMFFLRLYYCDDCHWWVLRKRWLFYGEGVNWESGLLIVGMPKPNKIESTTTNSPWKEFLTNELAEDHCLPISNEILSLFSTNNKLVINS